MPLTEQRWVAIEPALRQYARHLFPPWSDVWQDAVQEAAIALHVSADVRDHMAFARCVIWRVKNHWLRVKGRTVVFNHDYTPDGAVPVERTLVLRQALDTALSQLNPRYQAAVLDEDLMRGWKKSDRRETNLVHRAKQRMRAALRAA